MKETALLFSTRSRAYHITSLFATQPLIVCDMAHVASTREMTTLAGYPYASAPEVTDVSIGLLWNIDGINEMRELAASGLYVRITTIGCVHVYEKLLGNLPSSSVLTTIGENLEILIIFITITDELEPH